MKTIALFNSRSGVGKSFLAYHVAWMFHHLGVRVAVADLDPQTHLTGAFVDDERSEELSIAQPRKTILGAIEAASQSARFIMPHVEEIDGIELVPGDVGLAGWEDRFARAWRDCLDDDPRIATTALLLTTSIHNIAEHIRSDRNVDVLLLDLGPALSAINRAVLVAADAVIIPVAPDTPSRLALSVVGKALDDWRKQWDVRRTSCHARGMSLPAGLLAPIGYVVLEQAASPKRGKFGLYALHASQLARVFHDEVLRDEAPSDGDPMCLAWLRHLRGLLNLHLEARKPVFDLKAADGAIGTYAVAVGDARVAFENLAREIGKRAGIAVPERD